MDRNRLRRATLVPGLQVSWAARRLSGAGAGCFAPRALRIGGLSRRRPVPDPGLRRPAPSLAPAGPGRLLGADTTARVALGAVLASDRPDRPDPSRPVPTALTAPVAPGDRRPRSRHGGRLAPLAPRPKAGRAVATQSPPGGENAPRGAVWCSPDAGNPTATQSGPGCDTSSAKYAPSVQQPHGDGRSRGDDRVRVRRRGADSREGEPWGTTGAAKRCAGPTRTLDGGIRGNRRPGPAHLSLPEAPATPVAIPCFLPG